jgi:hypothetical protein
MVTAYRDALVAITTIERLFACDPIPNEILVHVDGNMQDCVDAIRRRFPSAAVLLSTENIGPGGARNKLLRAAKNEILTRSTRTFSRARSI